MANLLRTDPERLTDHRMGLFEIGSRLCKLHSLAASQPQYRGTTKQCLSHRAAGRTRPAVKLHGASAQGGIDLDIPTLADRVGAAAHNSEYIGDDFGPQCLRCRCDRGRW